MFGYGYREDALKWRDHRNKLNYAELNKTAKMVCKVYLVDGSVLDYILECTGLLVDCHYDEPYVIKAEDRIIHIYSEKCHGANKNGIHIDGSFYPADQIKRIQQGEIEVTHNAQ